MRFQSDDELTLEAFSLQANKPGLQMILIQKIPQRGDL